MREEKMHGNKTDQTRNGQFKKTRQHPWKKFERVWIPELRLWILVRKSLSKAAKKQQAAKFLERYQKQGQINFGMENGKV